MPIGRNTDDLLQTVDAVKHVEKNDGRVCPAGWRLGTETITEDRDSVGAYLADDDCGGDLRSVFPGTHGLTG